MLWGSSARLNLNARTTSGLDSGEQHLTNASGQSAETEFWDWTPHSPHSESCEDQSIDKGFAPTFRSDHGLPPLFILAYCVSKVNCAPEWTRTTDAQWAGDLQSPGIAAIRPTQ